MGVVVGVEGRGRRRGESHRGGQEQEQEQGGRVIE